MCRVTAATQAATATGYCTGRVDDTGPVAASTTPAPWAARGTAPAPWAARAQLRDRK